MDFIEISKITKLRNLMYATSRREIKYVVAKS